jgi:hypothetical protein
LILHVIKRRSLRRRNYGFAAAMLVCCAAATWPWGRWEVPSPLASPSRVSENRAGRIVTSLQRNIYRAFESPDEAEVYDALALSVDGPLLRDLYLRVRRSLEMQEQGGAVSRVRDVELLEGRIESPVRSESTDERTFAYRCRWTVAGTVEHWGHVHERTNEYAARFCLEPRQGTWKITQLEVLDEKRLDFKTKLRGL